MNTTASNVLMYCLITNLPGPFDIKTQELSFQLYPIDRTKCPGIDSERDITFELYTSENSSMKTILKIGYPVKNLNFAKNTVMFVHGFLESSNSIDAVQLKNAYLKRGDHNVILVNTQRLTSGPFFLSAVRNVIPIAQYMAQFIEHLGSQGLSFSQLHLVGMSLGAQIVGVAGSMVKKGRISRITGLDPAGPVFYGLGEDFRLDKSDAKFVDVIHTDAGGFGYPKEQGHADFWVNGGRATQPGCRVSQIAKRKPIGSLSEQIFCNHWRAYQVYIPSITNETAFLASNCKNWDSYLENQCNNNEKVALGYATPKSARGNYYLDTDYPY